MSSVKMWAKTIQLSNNFLYLCTRIPILLTPSWGSFLLFEGLPRRGIGRVEVFRHNNKAFTWRLFLTFWNFATFKSSHEHCNGRCPRDVFIHIPLLVWHFAYSEVSYIRIGISVYISAWASTLLVQLDWAMRRPQNVGRVTRRSHAFCFFLAASLGCLGWLERKWYGLF